MVLKRLNWPLFWAIALVCACFLATQGLVKKICQTAGCTLYQDVTIFGLSLWWYGLAAALVLTVLAASHRFRLGFWFLNLALLFDSALLLLLALSSTCLNCLLIALGFGLTYLAFRQKLPQIPKLSQIIFLLWLMLWGAAAVNMLKPSLGSWPIQSGDDPHVRIYFSPSCPRCQDAVNFYSGNLDAAFFPVEDAEDDLAKIAQLELLLKKNLSLKEALASLKTDPASHNLDSSFNLDPIDKLKLYLRLTLNKSHLLAQGSMGVPYIEYRGLPKIISREIKRQEKAAQSVDISKQEDAQNYKTSAKSEPAKDSQNLGSDSAPNMVEIDDLLGPTTSGQCQKDSCH